MFDIFSRNLFDFNDFWNNCFFFNLATKAGFFSHLLKQRDTGYGPVFVRLPVCLSQDTSRSYIKTDARTELFFLAWRLPFICVIRKSEYLEKWRYFPLKLCLKLWTQKKFATASRRVLTTKLVNDRSCWPHLRQSTRRGRTHYTSVDRNAVTPLLRFAVRMLCNLFVQLCSRWQHFEWHSASRGPSVVAEILVIFYRRCLQSEPHGTGWLQQCAAARDTCVVYLSVASVSLMIAITALSRSWITCSQARRRSISINSMCQWINV